jgi:hypothetical protein
MANIDEPATCSSCAAVLPQQRGQGRRRLYCDASCRSAARRARGNTGKVSKGNLDSDLADVAHALDQARRAEETLRNAIARARAAGHTWQEVGDVLGTSRQAAFQRFGRGTDPTRSTT